MDRAILIDSPIYLGIGNFQNYYSTQLLRDYSNSDISWILSLQVFFMMATVYIPQPIFPTSNPQSNINPGPWLINLGSRRRQDL